MMLQPKNIRIEHLEVEIKEQLPLGSPRKMVEAWFASHEIEPMDISDLSGRRIGLGTAIPNDGLFEEAEIRIEFYFDSDDRLRKAVVYRFVRSL